MREHLLRCPLKTGLTVPVYYNDKDVISVYDHDAVSLVIVGDGRTTAPLLNVNDVKISSNDSHLANFMWNDK